MRKAPAFIMVLLIVCCSVSYAADTADAAMAVNGVYDGVMSAMASYLSQPRIALQGVRVVQGEGIIPRRISFVRSDVSTYSDSLSFFGNGPSFSASQNSMERLPSLIPMERVISRLRRAGWKAGEVVLDGSVRVTESEGAEAESFISSDDWSFLSVRFSVSMAVTGASVNGGAVVEGTFLLSGGTGRTVTIEAESLTVDNVPVDAAPAVISFGG